jgi:hypothetical protein
MHIELKIDADAQVVIEYGYDVYYEEKDGKMLTQVS